MNTLCGCPASVIVTTSAQATRAADNATITDLSKNNFNQSEGTVYAEFVVQQLGCWRAARHRKVVEVWPM